MTYTLTNKEANDVVRMHKGLLINFTAKHAHKLYNWDEVYAIGLATLIECSQTIDLTKASMAHYAHTCMYRAVKDAYELHLKHTKFRTNITDAISHKTFRDQTDILIDLDVVLSDLSSKERQIIELYHLKGDDLHEIAHKFGVSLQRIKQIEQQALKKLIHKYGDKNLSTKNTNRKEFSRGTLHLNLDTARKIRKESQEGLSARLLSVKYGVSPANIRKIVRHISWKEVN